MEEQIECHKKQYRQRSNSLQMLDLIVYYLFIIHRSNITIDIEWYACVVG